ncbi:RagB/SusD family nutrient uptake outer membrane protein [Bacteroides reticulotermitis]|uniref:Outer membrane protein n=1 Tax=Bacteroides reticulotermitis JCM 10512 TaxID=1445607 RepID=W4UZZ5_9BACE|nr:RagB/SusD family nutrient uptake outer membrane protein [Bacteroides reticulotermitis]GAE86531.1 outer membrane protein [Bacteroides reticulotermitis JCM 10512]
MKTRAEAEALANAVYGPLQTLSSSYTFLVESATETTISFEEVDDSKDGPQVSVFETTPSNWYPIKVFNRLYKSIGAANLAIEEIGTATSNSNLTDADKALLVARAKFVRGYSYFQLVQLFGEVPLVLTSKSTERTRASIDVVYDQVVNDLTEALPNLPAFDSNKSNPTQNAVNTILAKVYLTWGQKPITSAEISAIAGTTDPTKPAPDTEKLQKAVDYANKVINSGKYQLLDSYNSIWGVANENNAEVIFSIHHDGDGIDAQGNHQTHCGFTWPKSARTDPHISYADITLENRIPSEYDTRKQFSYATRVEYTDGVVDTLTWPVSIVRPGKWIHRTTDGTYKALDAQPNSIDHIDFRYAEVLLIKAEALFFSNKASEALTVVNEVRKRAFGGHYEHGGKLSTLTKEDLYNEWDYEFAFEQKHWLNLVRWRTLLTQVKTTVPNYEYYKPEYKSAATIKAAFPEIANKINAAFYARVHTHLHAKVDNLNGKFYRFPIPLSEDYTNLGITPQNPGY